jgi:flagellin-like hook-associated protein FlgL
VDLLGTLTALEAALAANDVAGVRASLGGLERSVAQVASARAELGVSMGSLDTANAAAELAADEEKVALVRTSETDLAEASLRLAQAQSALEASMAATAQVLKLSLLDFLR